MLYFSFFFDSSKVNLSEYKKVYNDTQTFKSYKNISF